MRILMVFDASQPHSPDVFSVCQENEQNGTAARVSKKTRINLSRDTALFNVRFLFLYERVIICCSTLLKM